MSRESVLKQHVLDVMSHVLRPTEVCALSDRFKEETLFVGVP